MITSAFRLPSSYSSLQPILGSLVPECFKYTGVRCLKTSAIYIMYHCVSDISETQSLCHNIVIIQNIVSSTSCHFFSLTFVCCFRNMYFYIWTVEAKGPVCKI